MLSSGIDSTPSQPETQNRQDEYLIIINYRAETQNRNIQIPSQGFLLSSQALTNPKPNP